MHFYYDCVGSSIIKTIEDFYAQVCHCRSSSSWFIAVLETKYWKQQDTCYSHPIADRWYRAVRMTWINKSCNCRGTGYHYHIPTTCDCLILDTFSRCLSSESCDGRRTILNRLLSTDHGCSRASTTLIHPRRGSDRTRYIRGERDNDIGVLGDHSDLCRIDCRRYIDWHIWGWRMPLTIVTGTVRITFIGTGRLCTMVVRLTMYC